MARKTVPDLKELFKQAAEIAKQVPESMQDAAFNRALEMLAGDAPEQPEARRSTPRRTAGPSKGKQDRSSSADQQTSAGMLVESIESTQHPGVTSSAKVLDRSLMILQIAREYHGVDGLSPSEISSILTDKFRISTSAAAVSTALGKATHLVNRVPRGKGFQYRIMAPGEKYLSSRDGKASPSPKRPSKKRAKSRTEKKASVPEKEPAPKATTSKKRKSKSSKKSTTRAARPGPGAMLRELIAAGFFSKAKTISEIQEHAEHNLAHTYGVNELSTPLRRAIHSKLLVRAKNSDGQYEYTSN
ncbi:MAG: hypothetical protein QOH06_5714 [Acidobacteriota bacterium]|jgi:hypothetical protein|nr:hypothetical protein [Acidobacteriota bacterium]